MPRLSQLSQLTALDINDYMYIVDANAPSGNSKKVSLYDLREFTRTNPYCFRAYNSVTTPLPDAVTTQVSFGVEEYDYNGNFAANVYTAPFAGVFHFEAAVTISGGTASPVDFALFMMKNGSLVTAGTRFVPSASDCTGMISAEILLAQGDVIDIRAYQNTAGAETTQTGTQYTWFAGHLVHKV